MIEIRFHGRGGQGVVTAARLLAEAAFIEGKYAQAFPFFGAERRGAPVLAFSRINDKEIRARTQVYEPDYVIVLDPFLPEVVDVVAGLKQGGIVVLNSKKAMQFPLVKTVFVDATSIAMATLGAPITNTAMLGAFAKATGVVKLESLTEVIKEYFPAKLVEKNTVAIKEAYEKTEVA
jgi:2-oxoacid:acceptor oxidoreductase gamma subunit (pyruvate/2-ketoisovalerate family)